MRHFKYIILAGDFAHVNFWPINVFDKRLYVYLKVEYLLDIPRDSGQLFPEKIFGKIKIKQEEKKKTNVHQVIVPT